MTPHRHPDDTGPDEPRRFRIVGPGRAGGALGEALSVLGWERLGDVRRGDDPAGAAVGADLVVLSVPDAVITDVAAAIRPRPDVVVTHLAGSLGLDVLAPHPRRAALHPLMALPSAEVGARRLRSGGWFAVAGDPLVERIVADLGGRSFTVDDPDRAVYHATAAIASNHLVALLGQVERLAGGLAVPVDAFLELVRASVDDVAELGAADALTGPVARGDWGTVARHLDGLPASERPLYRALAAEAARLCGREPPPDL